MTRPQVNEAATYYSRYIDLISGDDIVATLKSQLEDTKLFLTNISEEQSLKSYAPGKWTIRQMLNHVNDTERVFASRAFWFARGFPDALPSFDQDICVQAAGANDVLWTDLKNEFTNIRQSTISFFENLPTEAWMRTGVASNYPFTVNALSYIIAGHVAHHCNVIQERYL
jgi:DinB superfamily